MQNKTLWFVGLACTLIGVPLLFAVSPWLGIPIILIGMVLKILYLMTERNVQE